MLFTSRLEPLRLPRHTAPLPEHAPTRSISVTTRPVTHHSRPLPWSAALSLNSFPVT